MLLRIRVGVVRSLFGALSVIAVVASLAATDGRAATRPSCLQVLGSITKGVGTPAEIAGPVPAGVLSEFAVLRRAQVVSDVMPTFAPVGDILGIELGSYYATEVRRIALDRYLVFGHTRVFGVPPARCLPKAVRGQRSRLARQRRLNAARLSYCVSTSILDTCEPISNLTTERDMAEQEFESNSVQELIPDGVQSVALSYRNAPAQTVAVTNNQLQFTIPPAARQAVRGTEAKIDEILFSQFEHPNRPLSAAQRHALRADDRVLDHEEHQLVPRAVVWRSASSAVIRTVHPPLIRAPQKLLPDSVVQISVGVN